MAPDSPVRNTSPGMAEVDTEAPPSPSSYPPLGAIKVSRQYFYELTIRRKLANHGNDATRETNYRLQGINLIQEVRTALGMPINTYTAACTFYHRFRLKYPGSEYNCNDAALACLWAACKSEDTLKKSKEILCASYNIKNPGSHTHPDDKIFENQAKMLIGLERHIIETLRFDFRVRYPQTILCKLVKEIAGSGTLAKQFYGMAFQMSVDMYKTFAPMKQTTFTCAVMVAQLTSLITNQFRDKFMALDFAKYHTRLHFVSEIMLDVLDLYTDHHNSTLLGKVFDVQVFINVKIRVNAKLEESRTARYFNYCAKCFSNPAPPSPSDGSPASPHSTAGTNSTIKRGTRRPDETIRFLFDAAEARHEHETYEHLVDDDVTLARLENLVDTLENSPEMPLANLIGTPLETPLVNPADLLETPHANPVDLVRFVVGPGALVEMVVVVVEVDLALATVADLDQLVEVEVDLTVVVLDQLVEVVVGSTLVGTLATAIAAEIRVPADAAQNRQNQQRSRARQREYVADLERRVRAYEARDARATVEMQRAAREVAWRNERLVAMLRSRGVSAEEIERFLRAGEGEGAAGEGEVGLMRAGRGVEVGRGSDGRAGADGGESRAGLGMDVAVTPLSPPRVAQSSSAVDVVGRAARQAIFSPASPEAQSSVADPAAAAEPMDNQELAVCNGALSVSGSHESAGTDSRVLMTSCDAAASIIADFHGHGDATEARMILGCGSKSNCHVKNTRLFQLMDEAG
ncbi:Uu.00g021400.m01.CDS01 [Anthostomella pinea]|uniref:RNA polymerase II holoenzyme cyclin-like subunit n=1 Tax=Anthostomella pinea TaxID=933095 RepID=A0AAI8VTU5_9PEZI|nr:Uu.00g021400.m01.CDS01 [Anthostomella pinea]